MSSKIETITTTTTTTTQQSTEHWGNLQAILDRIDALPHRVVDNLSSITDTDEPLRTMRALYRMAAALAVPGRALGEHFERERTEFLHYAYALATVRAVFDCPEMIVEPFREWCLRASMGSDSNETLDLALMLLERVRPPNLTWAEWLAQVAETAEED